MPTRRAFIKAAGCTVASGLIGASCRPSGPADAPDSSPEISTLLAGEEALFRPTPEGCTIHWIPRGPLEARVVAGSSPGAMTTVYEGVSDEPSEVVISAHGGGTELHLQCSFRPPGAKTWNIRPVRRIRRTRSAGQSYRVALIADSHVYASPVRPRCMENIIATSDQVCSDDPDFTIFLGDEGGVYYLADKPGYMNQQRADQRWAIWRGAFAPLLARVPSFLVLGNHEGEAGYHQRHPAETGEAYLQRWGTIARKRHLCNPLPGTYPEGGEDEGWSGLLEATGGAREGNRSPLQNYFAWTCGDVLFAVLDVHRYTSIGGAPPVSVDEWTLGTAQLRWFERVLTDSAARWKIVIAHHVVGGYEWDKSGRIQSSYYVYGRGGARYARVGEQARITNIMKRAGARLFLYGHDHVFAHQEAEGIHFVCCGRPSFLTPRPWSSPGWREAYGNASSRNPRDFHAAIGYTRLDVSPDRLTFAYVRTGHDALGAENVDAKVGEVVYAYSIM